MSVPEWIAWSGAIADIVAGLCLAWPALRFSRRQLQLDRIAAGSTSDETLETLRARLLAAGHDGLGRWDETTHRLLAIGVVAFVYGAIVRLALLAFG